MKKTLSIIILIAMSVAHLFAQNVENERKTATKDIILTLARNLNAGYSYNNTSNYRLNSYNIGTSYAQSFKKLPKAHWQIGAYVHRSDYQMKNNTPDFETTSVSVPFRVGYQVVKNDIITFRLNAGPSYEYVFYNNYASSSGKIQSSQLGLSVGATVQILNITNVYISYKYFPTGLLSNNDFQRSSFNFSIGL